MPPDTGPVQLLETGYGRVLLQRFTLRGKPRYLVAAAERRVVLSPDEAAQVTRAILLDTTRLPGAGHRRRGEG